ncbi:MAG: cytochrome c3 family protein [Nitrospirota bacterium]
MGKINRRFSVILILIIFICSLFLIGRNSESACGDPDTICGSKHDLSSLTGAGIFQATDEDEICIFCHTPHNAIVQDSSGNRLPLWNRSISRNESGFTVYSSSTLNATVGQPSGVSLLCMSCHDGVTAINSLINFGQTNPITMNGFDQIGDVWNPSFPRFPGANIGGATPNAYAYAPYGGTDSTTKRLDDDHPVSFVFDVSLVAADGGLQLPAAGDPLKLYNSKLECSTCHDPHKEGNPAIQGANHTFPFLRKTNNASALCSTCHLK